MTLPDVGGWSPVAKLLGFATASAVAAAAAFAVGASVEPLAAEESAAHASDQQEGEHSSAAEQAAPEGSAAAAEVAGLAMTEQGYTLVPHDTTFASGAETPFTFTVLGPDGEPVTDYRLSHEKELHLIVVRRDLAGFQHVHPARAADGSWSIPLGFPAAGTYRVFADFEPTALAGDSITLGADVSAAGRFAPTPLPDPARTTRVADYQVSLEGKASAGQESELTFRITRGGEPVGDLDPYLGLSATSSRCGPVISPTCTRTPSTRPPPAPEAVRRSGSAPPSPRLAGTGSSSTSRTADRSAPLPSPSM